jgi:hypothetical protein
LKNPNLSQAASSTLNDRPISHQWLMAVTLGHVHTADLTQHWDIECGLVDKHASMTGGPEGE